MANLRFDATLMWDGRETASCATLTSDLRRQANHATTGHAQGTSDVPNDALTQIVQSELGIYFGQFIDAVAGRLSEDGARGGPIFLAQLPFYPGINAFDGSDPDGGAHRSKVFTLYEAWRSLPGGSDRDRARRQIAEGEQLFDTRVFTIRGVSGFNDDLARAEITGTCGACHDTPNVGTNSEGRLMDIGISDQSRRGADAPLYTLRQKSTGALARSTDPGQALISKQWAHLNRFKVPNLRGAAGRAPYFHDGSSSTLEAVVDYHDKRFGIDLTADEKAALVAFLSAL
jgi:hypothetical protein